MLNGKSRQKSHSTDVACKCFIQKQDSFNKQGNEQLLFYSGLQANVGEK